VSAEALRRRAETGALPLLALLAFCAVPLVSSSASLQNTVTLALVWSFWALSLNIIWGYAGQFSMAQIALGGLAAYAFSLLAVKSGMDQFLAVLVATAGTVVVSVLVGLVCLRLAEFRFAIMTLAFALAGVGLAGGLAVTGQSAGLAVPGHWATLDLGAFTWNLNGRLGGFSALLLGVFLVALTGLWALLRTRSGRGMLAIREDAVLAESLGVAADWHRLLAFALSAVVASLAGVFQAEYYTYIYPSLFSFETLVSVIVVLTLGGRGRLFGPLVGGILYASLTNLLHVGGRFQTTVFGVAVILLTILARHGLSYYLGQGQRSLVRLVLDPAQRRALGAGLAARGRRRGPAAGDPDAREQRLVPLAERRPQTAAGGGPPVAARSLAGDAPVLLEGKGLTKRFGGLTAVGDFSFVVREGEILGLIGPNGAGKTTAFNLVSGFARPDAGSLAWRGRTITRASPHVRARLGLVRTFQQPRVFPQLTVRQNLVIAAQSHPGRRGAADELRQILDDFGMAELADAPAEQLAYGFAKRLGVAMALATGSEMLMLDEPAAGLNGADVHHLRDDLVRLREQGRTVWLVEHHMELVMTVCDRVIVLDAGNVIADGTPAEVMAHPQVLEAYLGGAA
jgi:branched-chain amino acid transport system permease protein